MNFHVGQKVACVDDSMWIASPRFPRIPRKGEVFTIRSIFIGFGYDGPETGLRFEEIICGIIPLFNDEAGFQASCFRPVRTTDISSLVRIAEEITARGKIVA